MPSVAAFVRGWFNEPAPTFELRQASARWGQPRPRAARRSLRVADVVQETPSTRTFVLAAPDVAQEPDLVVDEPAQPGRQVVQEGPRLKLRFQRPPDGREADEEI